MLSTRRAAGDGEQPGAGRGTAFEAVQAAEGPQEGVLGQVLGALRIGTEEGHVVADVPVQGAYERSTATGSPVRAASAQAVMDASLRGRTRLPAWWGQGRSDHLCLSFSGSGTRSPGEASPCGTGPAARRDRPRGGRPGAGSARPVPRGATPAARRLDDSPVASGDLLPSDGSDPGGRAPRSDRVGEEKTARCPVRGRSAGPDARAVRRRGQPEQQAQGARRAGWRGTAGRGRRRVRRGRARGRTAARPPGGR